MASGILCMAVLVLLLASGVAASMLARPYYGRYDYDYDYDYAYRPPSRYIYRRPFYSAVYRYPYAAVPYIPADYPSYYGRYGRLGDFDYGLYGGYGAYGGYDGYGGYGLYRGYSGYYL